MKLNTLTIFAVIYIFGSCMYFSDCAKAWTISSDFEQGALNQVAEGVSGFNIAGSATTYSNDLWNSGNKSAKEIWTQGSDPWGIDAGFFTHSTYLHQGDELWFRGYFYFQEPWSWTTSSFIKIMRTTVYNSAGVVLGRISILADTNGQIVGNNEVSVPQINIETGTIFSANQWQSIEMYIKFSTSSPAIRIWKDGVLIGENTSSATLKNSDDEVRGSLVFTTWNGNVPANQISYVDDFELTNNRPASYDIFRNYMIGPLGWENPIDTIPPNKPNGMSVD